jgi:endonuclease YncB( thermonuclease family)
MTIGISLRFILISLFMFSISAGAAEVLEGRVVGVHDGDTITLLLAGNQQLKIRLAQIFSRSTRRFVHNYRIS